MAAQEKPGIHFTVAPLKWEQNGVLFSTKNLIYTKKDSLRLDLNSTPDFETWEKFAYILKYDNQPRRIRYRKEINKLCRFRCEKKDEVHSNYLNELMPRLSANGEIFSSL